MSTVQGTPGEGKSSSLGRSGVWRIIQVPLYAALYALVGVVLFASAGRLDWTMGWVLIGLYVLYLVFCAFFVLPKNPEAFNERSRWGKGTKGWDKAFAILYMPMPYVTAVVAGLDAVRFGWSQMPLALSTLGIVMLLAGMLVAAWAIMSNPYFSTTVRIQADRGHRTVTSGPYQYVRHPGYMGAILSSIGTPLLLGSWWALVPGGLTAVMFIVRTALEDRTLQEELGGYAEYVRSVRYRLMPGVW